MSCSSCNENHYGANQCYAELVSEILTGLFEGDVLLDANRKVELLYETKSNPRPWAGDPGQTVSSRKVELMPPPRVRTNLKLVQPDGTIIEREGFAKLERIVGYSEADFISATNILIDGCKWDLVGGSITRPANGVFLEMLVQRTKGNQ